MPNLFHARPLSRARVITALLVAMSADAVQFASGPLGWVFFDQIVDVIAAAIESLLLGFHPLLLPTFLVELIPVVDMLPTWTACVSGVILLRRRLQSRGGPAPPVVPPARPGESSRVIDV